MDELKEIIAKNLTELRTCAHLTQLQLAEMLNYSDKAVSKWERGEAVPDIRVLKKLADIYNITVDDIITDGAGKKAKPKLNVGKKRLLVTLLSVGLVFFIATVVFMILFFVKTTESYAYLSFVFAPFACSVLLIVFSAKWGNWITNIIAVIFHIFVAAFTDFNKIYFIYIVAAVFEILIVLWFTLRKLALFPFKRKDK